MFPPMALGLPVLASIVFAQAEVSSLSLSPTDVASGAASTATVTLDPTPPPAADAAADLPADDLARRHRRPKGCDASRS